MCSQGSYGSTTNCFWEYTDDGVAFQITELGAFAGSIWIGWQSRNIAIGDEVIKIGTLIGGITATGRVTRAGHLQFICDEKSNSVETLKRKDAFVNNVTVGPSSYAHPTTQAPSNTSRSGGFGGGFSGGGRW